MTLQIFRIVKLHIVDWPKAAAKQNGVETIRRIERVMAIAAP